MKSPRLILLSLAVIALLAGCGKSNGPTSSVIENELDSAAPPAPEQVSLSVDPETAGGVLVWSASGAADVVRYEVHEYAPSPLRESSYTAVFASEGPVTHWAVPSVVSTTTKYYRVCAIDAEGNRSPLTPIRSFVLSPAPQVIPQGPSPTKTPFEG